MGKYQDTMIKKYGSRENWVTHLRQIGGKGGSKTGVIKGFAANPELAVIAGKKGGAISKRKPKVVK
jgi:general stress protein YciG